jgi:glucose/arabinose dehydrogenase
VLNLIINDDKLVKLSFAVRGLTKESNIMRLIMYKNLLSVLFLLLIPTLSFQVINAGISTMAFAQEENVPSLKDTSLGIELVSDSLKDPTSMAFIGPNDILVTEKNSGTVQRILNGEMLDEPLLDVNVDREDERGMLGIAVSRNSTVGKSYVFLFYTEAEPRTMGNDGEDDDNGGDGRINNGDGGPIIGNRIYRYELSENRSKLVNPKLLLDLPYQPNPSHNGGVITIGPDSNLYLTIGELTHTFYSQDDYRFTVQNYEDGQEPDGRAGILRVTQDGGTVKGLIGDQSPLDKYFAYGIRNSFGIAFDPLTGNFWDTENGPTFGDEINLVEPGFNSGWAKVLGIWNIKEAIDEEGRREILKGEPVSENISGDLFNFNGSGRYSSPELTWDESIAPTSIAFLNSSNLGGQYENDMFVGTANDILMHFDLTGNNRSELLLNGSLADKVANSTDELEDATFAENLGIITDLEVGPDGNLYVLTGVREPEGKIYRIVSSTT